MRAATLLRVGYYFILFILFCPSPSFGDVRSPASPTLSHPRGAGFFLPLGSVFIPGLGQYVQGAPMEGLAFTGVAVGGYVAGASLDVANTSEDLPRDADEQFSQLAFQTAATSGFLSAYDSFHRSLPGLQARGGYRFATSHGTTGSLFSAPFEFSFLRDWRTSVVVGGIAVLGIVAAATETTGEFFGHDALFTAGISYNAGVGEEAVFRGWLYPWLHQLSGERWWLSNPIQSLLFGAAHLGSVSVPVVQTLFGFYQGWMVSRNEWNVRESIFQHFWWDVIAIGVSLLTDEEEPSLSIGLPVMRF